MTPRDPPTLRIRNQRYPRWGDALGGMLFVLLILGCIALFIVPRQYDRIPLIVIFGSMLAMVPLFLYGMFQLWDLRRPVTKPSVTVRVLFDWLVLGIRRKELGPADGFTALTPFRGLLSQEYSVHHLELGDEIEVETPMIRFRASSAERVRFAPDPKEDYIGAEAPLQFCEAIVEMDSGKKFKLIVTEADAHRLRHWANSKGIAVCDCDGYSPRPIQPASEK